MNLEQATALSNLRRPETVVIPQRISNVKAAGKVLERCARNGYPYKHFPVNTKGATNWARKFLDSKEFVLMRIDINAVASPREPRDPKRVAHYLKCNAAEFDPILVDVNKRREGKTLHGYCPEVIVIDGKHRRKAMLAQGHAKIMAWVGVKALKKIKPSKVMAASSLYDMELPKVDGTPIAAAFDLFAATVPTFHPPAIRQDTGAGGSRPKDHLHGKKNGKNGKEDEVCACGARSTGSLEEPSGSDTKVPPDSSDDGSFVEASDRLKWNPDKPQIYPSGAKPGDANRFSSPVYESPGSGVGPRVKNTGAHNSEMTRNMHAGGPGSGRHPEFGAMVKHARSQGFSRPYKTASNYNKQGVGTPSHTVGMDKGDQDHSLSIHEKTGEWNLTPLGRGTKSGIGLASLQQAMAKHSKHLQAGKTIKKIWTKDKKKMKARMNPMSHLDPDIYAEAPPGFSEDTMHSLKRKHGTESAFKIAWSTYNKSHGKKAKHA